MAFHSFFSLLLFVLFSGTLFSAEENLLVRLKEGNNRFSKDQMEHSAQNTAARKALEKGQKPFAIVVSCSDSRVSPEIIFDQGLGQLFVVRSAGEVLTEVGIASVEYAVEHLHASLIVILGHESCGAVKAALSAEQNKSNGSPNLDSLINNIIPNIKNTHTADDILYRKSGKAQVNGVASTLLKQSKIVQEKVEKGELKISLGLYSLQSGEVEFWNTKH